MSVAIIFSVNAEKELMKLPKLIAKRIAEKIIEFSKDKPPTKRAKKLNNHQSAEYRYRVGY
jgi:mRNA-degrading endonuclease RelE of RelBE toxin-antitoxin system